jgi:hypothetical protein
LLDACLPGAGLLDAGLLEACLLEACLPGAGLPGAGLAPAFAGAFVLDFEGGWVVLDLVAVAIMYSLEFGP